MDITLFYFHVTKYYRIFCKSDVCLGTYFKYFSQLVLQFFKKADTDIMPLNLD